MYIIIIVITIIISQSEVLNKIKSCNGMQKLVV